MNKYKKYLILINYRAYGGWGIHAEVDKWSEAITFYNAVHNGGHEVILVRHCPVRCTPKSKRVTEAK